MVATFDLLAIFFASTLLPSERIIFADGPINKILFLTHSSTKSGFSDRKP